MACAAEAFLTGSGRIGLELMTARFGPSDPSALMDEAWRAHGGQLYRLALRLCGDPQVAEDATADAFAKVLAHRSIDQVDDLYRYLRRTLVNQVNQWFRRRAVERGWQKLRTGDARGALAVENEAVERMVVGDAMAALSQGQRTVLVLRYYEHLSVAETAEAMAVSEGTVKSQTSRALERMRVLIDEIEPIGTHDLGGLR